MGIQDTLEGRKYEFQSSTLGMDSFVVVSIQGKEGLSRLYEFEVTLISENAEIDLESVLYKGATLKILGPDLSGANAEYHGIVTRFEQSRKVDQFTFYQARLEPKLWLLSQTFLSEVYLEKTIPQLIEQILQGGGLTNLDYEVRTSQSYRVWPYICQYQENYLTFISRLMERDGFYYFFEPGQGQEKLVITDEKSFHTAPVKRFNYQSAGDLNTVTDDSIQALACKQQPLPTSVMIKNYNYRKAALHISQGAQVSANGVGEVTLYGENVETQAEAQRIAKVRAEAIAWRGRLFYGESTAIGIRTGNFFELAHHFRSAFNARYLPVEVTHEGSQSALLLSGLGVSGLSGEQNEVFYRNEFTAIPANVQFRPERTTPWPRMDGVMNAFIDAEGSGQYAEVDEYGRYKVQLPFDKTTKSVQKASAWIRLSTPYSDPRSGMHFPLRKNAEVLLAFVDGDPDQPIIVSTVPNSENRNMVDNRNSTQNVIYTGGGNLFSLEDQAGTQNITLRTPTQDTYIAMGAVPVEMDQGPPPWAHNGNLSGHHINIHTNGNGRIKIGQHLESLVGNGTREPQNLQPGDYFQSNSNDLTVDVGQNSQTNVTGCSVTNVGQSPPASANGPANAGDRQLNTQGDIALTAQGKYNANTTGDYDVDVGGNYKVSVKGSTNVEFVGSTTETHRDVHESWSYGATTDTYLAAHNENYLGATNYNNIGEYLETYVGFMQEVKLAAAINLAAADVYNIVAGQEVKIHAANEVNLGASHIVTLATSIKSAASSIYDDLVYLGMPDFMAIT